MAAAGAVPAGSPFSEVRGVIDDFPAVDLTRVDELLPPPGGLGSARSAGELTSGVIAMEIQSLRRELRALGQGLEGILEKSVVRVEELLATARRSEQGPGPEEEEGAGLVTPPPVAQRQPTARRPRPKPLEGDDEPAAPPLVHSSHSSSAALWPTNVLPDSSFLKQDESLDPQREAVEQSSTAVAKASLHAWLQKSSQNAVVRRRSPQNPYHRRQSDLARLRMSRTSSASLTAIKRTRSCYTASVLLIIPNIVFMVVDAELSMHAAIRGREPPRVLWWVSLAFVLAFAAELAVRFWLEGRRRFFLGRLWRWNLFDGLVVLLQMVDLIGKLGNNIGFLRGLRILRVAPAARMVHAMRHVQELRLMLVTIRCSLASLFWAQVLLVFCLFCVALGFQQVVLAQVAAHGPDDVHPELLEYYGSTDRSLLTVFSAISGGADWRDLVKPLEEISMFYLTLFSVLVGFLLYGLLNILIGVFVECSARARQTSCLSNIQEALEAMDPENRGRISSEDFETILQDASFRAHLGLLGLDPDEVNGVFQVLDIDHEGTVLILDIVSALMRLTGQARSMDIATTLYENKRILAMVASLLDVTKSGVFGQQSAPGEVAV